MRFVNIVESVLTKLYREGNDELWNKIMDFYIKRYLNPDSLMKKNLKFSIHYQRKHK